MTTTAAKGVSQSTVVAHLDEAVLARLVGVTWYCCPQGQVRQCNCRTNLPYLTAAPTFFA